MSKAVQWLGSARTAFETRVRWALAKPRGAAAPGKAQVHLHRGDGGFVLSEWMVLSGLALAVLWTRLRMFVPLEGVSITKHFPGVVLVSGVVLTIVGSMLFRSRATAGDVACPPMRLLWPLLLLSAFMLAGSTYLSFVEKGEHTFRVAGSYMLVAYMTARVVLTSAHPGRFAMGYFVVLVIAAVPTIAVMGYFFAAGKANQGPFHELEFFVIPLAVFWGTRSRGSNLFTLTLFWVVVGCALLFRKNTAYLVALGVVAYTWLFHWRTNIRWVTALQSTLTLLMGVLLVVGAGGVYLYLRHTALESLPTGNPEFRLMTYRNAWQRFVDSPLWGAAFMAPDVQKFEGFDTGVAKNILPTHSDLLDLLAHGGLVAATLWALTHLLVFRGVYRHILSRRDEVPANIVGVTHTLCCMVLLGIVTYAFNPLWQNPTRALLVWANLGILAGLAAGYSRLPSMPAGPVQHGPLK